jgi:hypothetical protein
MNFFKGFLGFLKIPVQNFRCMCTVQNSTGLSILCVRLASKIIFLLSNVFASLRK